MRLKLARIAISSLACGLGLLLFQPSLISSKLGAEPRVGVDPRTTVLHESESVLIAHLVVGHEIGNYNSSRPGHPSKAVYQHLPTLPDRCMYELPSLSKVSTQPHSRVVQNFNYLVVVLAWELGREAVAESKDVRDFSQFEGGASVGCAY